MSEYVAGDESELSFSVRLAAYDLLEVSHLLIHL